LAFGIGANTAVFSVVRGVFLQPLPYRDPARLVDVLDASLKDPNLSKTFATYADFEEYARHSRSFHGHELGKRGLLLRAAHRAGARPAVHGGGWSGVDAGCGGERKIRE
jgi:hypothetical protein